jgi:hypothetical protein
MNEPARGGVQRTDSESRGAMTTTLEDYRKMLLRFCMNIDNHTFNFAANGTVLGHPGGGPGISG